MDSLELNKAPAILSPTQKQQQMKKRTEVLDDMMVELEEKAAMSNEEIMKIIEFMDFNNSGEVDEAEFTNAVRAAKRGQIKDEGISNLMARVDNELRIKQIRLKDLFKQLDSSGDGVLSRQELQYGLNMLCDVSWEQECERRKLRRIANHTRWKEKEEIRDKTKNWLLEAECLPKEFMEERDFFVRDIATPERFEKFLEVIVSGPQHTKAVSPRRSPRKARKTRADFVKDGQKEFAFDLESIDGEDMYEHLLKIVDDEMSIDSMLSGGGNNNNNNNNDDSSIGSLGDHSIGSSSLGTAGGNKSGQEDEPEPNKWTKRRRGSIGRRGRRRSIQGVKVGVPPEDPRSMDAESALAHAAEQVIKRGDDEEASVASVATMDSSKAHSTVGSLGGGSIASSIGGSIANQTQVTMTTMGSTMSAHSAAMLGQIRRSRGEKEQSDSEIESLVMLLGLNRRSVLSMKQRHFVERTFKNLYKARTSSLSNDYYLPRTVIDVMERENMMKDNTSGVVKRRKSVADIMRKAEEEEKMMQEWERHQRRLQGIDDDEDKDDESVVSMLPFDELSVGSGVTIETEEGLLYEGGEEEIAIPKEIQTKGREK